MKQIKPDRSEDSVKLELSGDYGENWSLLEPERFHKFMPIHNWIAHDNMWGWWIYRVIFEEGKGFTYEVFEDFTEAIAFYHKKIEITEQQRQQHLTTDWRSLRGIPFEDFIGDVFKKLGYAVKKTKASGDHGVDLVVTRGGHAVAIQAKGYDGKVGNGAVQEVHTGMVFYKCQACAVITNSDFTVAAHELAQATGCRLIGGDQIRTWIDGKIVV